MKIKWTNRANFISQATYGLVAPASTCLTDYRQSTRVDIFTECRNSLRINSLYNENVLDHALIDILGLVKKNKIMTANSQSSAFVYASTSNMT